MIFPATAPSRRRARLSRKKPSRRTVRFRSNQLSWTASASSQSAAQALDVVPLSTQPSVRPAKRSLLSTRVSLLLVAALVGGLAGHYASASNSGPGGVTIDAVTNKPGAGYLPGGM